MGRKPKPLWIKRGNLIAMTISLKPESDDQAIMHAYLDKCWNLLSPSRRRLFQSQVQFMAVLLFAYCLSRANALVASPTLEQALQATTILESDDPFVVALRSWLKDFIQDNQGIKLLDILKLTEDVTYD